MSTVSDPRALPADLAGDDRAVQIHLQDLDVSLGGAPVLRQVGLSLQAGRILALVGASGCGKTTLLRTIAGLQDPDRGEIRIAGRDVAHIPPERRGVGMVFQDGALFPHLSVRANVGFGLRRAERRSRRVDDALELVGLAALADRMPATLSGGQQQRVALARALVTQPAVLLLDEPFSSLDTGLRAQVRDDVVRLLREVGVTTIVVTHDQEEAFVMGDEVAVMVAGQIHQQATPAVMYAAPATLEVAAFLGDANLVTAAAHDTVAETWVGPVGLQQRAEGPVTVLVRPEHLSMTAGAAGTDGCEGTVLGVEFYGHDSITRVRTAGGILRVRTMAAPSCSRGDRVSLRYDGPPAHWFDASA